jgi:hypothetical protein
VVVIAIAAAVLVLLLLVVLLAERVGRLRRRLDTLTGSTDGTSFDGVLDSHLARVATMAGEVDSLAARSAVLEAAGRRAIQRVGLVRFNPFEDTGGNQSFALALVDASGGGLILSSLHSRTGTRVYAKAIREGRSDGALSDEEQEALRIALAADSGGERVRAGDRIARPA